MRIMMKVTMPHDTFNAAVRDGSAAKTLGRILDAARPEAAYFTEFDGHRTAILVVNLKDASEIPAYAEPWFLSFGADVEFHPAMTPDDLKAADIESIAKKWA